ncbi:MAG: VOC family protein [Rhodobacterales bacterium]|nr:VOC family protein [Rhodobacterales bacterium]
MTTQLEHINVTVSDPHATAKWLCDTFDWKIRWQGAAINGGFTIHVGSDTSYIAVYSPKTPDAQTQNNYATVNGLNHIAVTVDDLDETEQRVLAQGFKTINHGDYEPGKRFYFHDNDNIEYEVVSYTS